LVAECVETLSREGITKISLADTVAMASPENIKPLYELLIPSFPHIEFGAHLHTTPSNWRANVQAVYDGGGRKLEGALLGLGGCPMANDELTGNLPTENLLSYCDENEIATNIDHALFGESMKIASDIFSKSTHHAA
jgi:hydroxymethylglutaryl-CoA lyase